MSIVSAIVLFAVIWFLTLFVILPIGLQTQSDKGKIVRGTPGSAPAGYIVRRKFLQTTIAALIIWAGICAIILFDIITLENIDLYRRFRGAP